MKTREQPNKQPPKSTRNDSSTCLTEKKTYNPIGSILYGIFTYIYHKFQPYVGKYTIHGSYANNCILLHVWDPQTWSGLKKTCQIRRPSSPPKIPPLDLEDLVNCQVLAPKQGGYILELREAQLELEAMTKTLVALGDVLNSVGGRTVGS